MEAGQDPSIVIIILQFFLNKVYKTYIQILNRFLWDFILTVLQITWNKGRRYCEGIEKKTMEHESDNNTNGNWCFWYSH